MKKANRGSETPSYKKEKGLCGKANSFFEFINYIAPAYSYASLEESITASYIRHNGMPPSSLRPKKKLH